MRFLHSTYVLVAFGVLLVARYGGPLAFSAEAKVEPLADGEAEMWLRWVIPLPKQVRFEGNLAMPVADIALQLRRDATDIERQAADELDGLLAKKTGVKHFNGDFPIRIGICNAEGKIDGKPIPNAEKLSGLKNADQAYVITPLRPSGIAVAALTERGVYFGVKTLQQLLESRLAIGKLTMPIVTVLDWPDLAERGEWEFHRDLVGEIEFFADRKLNLIEAHCARLSLDDQGRGVATIDTELLEAARLRAIKWLPIITHLDQLPRAAIYKRYPEAKAEGEHARLTPGGGAEALCFSQPKTAELLAEWFTSLSSVKGVDEICVWLSEAHLWCSCPKCRARGQFVLEAEACIRAWQSARKKDPNVGLRILLTQGSYSTNEKVLAAASDPAVRVIYYDGGRTYNSSRDPLIYPLLEDFVGKGRWLGVYPQIGASWWLVCPWSGPQFVKFRMKEFVDKGLKCVCVRASSDDRFSDFNITAMAEWSWNAGGRNEREFALAWATRRGLVDPEKAADWAVMLGPVSWDVYGSGIPARHFRGFPQKMIESRAEPKLGSGMFRYFPTVKHIDHDLTICRDALKLAEDLGDAAIIGETQVIRGYVRMVKSTHTLASVVAGKQQLGDAERESLQGTFDELAHAAADVVDGLETWRKAILPDERPGRFLNAVNTANQTVSGIAAALAPFGIKQKSTP